MRILIIEPSFYLPDAELFRVPRLNIVGLTLPLLASLLPGHDVTLWFEKAQGDVTASPKSEVRSPRNGGAWDAVLISANHVQAVRACEIGDHFRACGVPVVMGGYFPSLNWVEAREHSDAVVIGEAEDTLPRAMAHATQTLDLVGFYRSQNDCPLEGMPHPRFDLVDPGIVHRRTLWAVQATRGCSRDCDFCVMRKVFGRTVRRRPVADVVDELDARGHRALYFVDDNLTLDRAYALELFGALAGRVDLGLVNMDSSVVDDAELLDAAAAAGVRQALVGFETLVDPEGAKGFGSVARYERLIDQLHARGIMVCASVMFGFDSDGPEVFALTLRQLERWRVEFCFPWILTPVLGSALMDRLVAEKRLRYGQDFWRLPLGAAGMRAVFEPALMSAAELEHGYGRFLRAFYSVPSMVRRLRKGSGGALPWALNLWCRRQVRRGLHPALQ